MPNDLINKTFCLSSMLFLVGVTGFAQQEKVDGNRSEEIEEIEVDEIEVDEIEDLELDDAEPGALNLMQIGVPGPAIKPINAHGRPKRKKAKVPKAMARMLTSDQVVFKNGDSLHGTLKAIKNGKVTWMFPEADKPMDFALDRIGKIEFAASPGRQNLRPILGVMANGDSLPASSVHYSKGKVTFDTDYAGLLSVPVGKVEELRFQGSGNAVYAGPTEMSEWYLSRRSNESGCLIKNGFFSVLGDCYLGREGGIPERARIDLDVSTNMNYLYVFLGTDRTKPYPQDAACISFDFADEAIGVGFFKAGGMNYESEYGVSSDTFAGKSGVHVTILVDRKACQLAVLVDFDPKFVLTESVGLSKVKGQGFCFFVDNGVEPAFLGNLRTSPWDGRVPTGDEAAISSRSDEYDWLLVHNGDRISGQVESIANEKVRLRSPYGVLSIPCSQLQRLVFKQTGEKQRLRKIVARGYLGSNVFLSFTSLEAASGKLLATTGVLKKSAYELKAFDKIIFNLEQTAMAAGDEDQIKFPLVKDKEFELRDDSNYDDEREESFFEHFK